MTDLTETLHHFMAEGYSIEEILRAFAGPILSPEDLAELVAFCEARLKVELN